MSAGVEGLVRYDAMCAAIEAAYEVDEVKEIRDKAKAIEVYARQSRNTTAETQACRIRLRAERRLGELGRQMEKAQGRRTLSDTRTKSEALSDAGITRQEMNRAEQLAAVPSEKFEAGLAEAKPSAGSSPPRGSRSGYPAATRCQDGSKEERELVHGKHSLRATASRASTLPVSAHLHGGGPSGSAASACSSTLAPHPGQHQIARTFGPGRRVHTSSRQLGAGDVIAAPARARRR